ncbi:MAG: DUF2339 domain-containing protein [bacterium]
MSKNKKEAFEENIITKWFSRIGILALVIGIGFLVKYAIDMNWISHTVRIILGVLLGVGLIITGELISKKKKYSKWAKTLVGGGFAITYLATFVSYYFEEYREAIGMSKVLNMIFLSIVIVFAIILSIKENSRIIAGESFFLGYITSLLFVDLGIMTAIYVLILTIGLVFVVSYKNWFIIGIGGIIASYLFYLIWHSNNSILLNYSSFVLISFFIAFNIQSFILSKKKESINVMNTIIIIVNSFLFFGIYSLQIYKYIENIDYIGLLALILSVFYFIGYFILKDKIDKKINIVLLSLTIFYITLAVPFVLDGWLITIFWALESLSLVILFTKTKINTLNVSSSIVAGLTIYKSFFYDLLDLSGFSINNILASTRLFSYLITIICFYSIYKIIRSNDKLFSKKNGISYMYSWASTLLLVLIILLEFVADYSVLVSLMLSIIAISLLYISKNNKFKELRIQSLVVSIILFLKILMYDSYSLSGFSINNILASTRLFSYLITIICFYFISWYLHREENKQNKSNIWKTIFSYTGTALSLLLIIIELRGFWISIGWMTLALTVFIIGIYRNRRHMRIQGVIIFSIVILKVFLYDTRSLDTIYRIIAYIVLGIILLFVSFIYTKYKEELKEKIV